MRMKSQSHKLVRAAGRRRLRRNKSGRYPIEKSPFWGLSSTHHLAELIGVPKSDLEAICMAPTYNCFVEQTKLNAKPGKEPRHIQEPIETTLKIHYRIVRHLDSIERPDFLHSATKKRSHVTNAHTHLDSGGAVVAMDIRKFFESTSYHHVKAFFYKDLKCTHDVARLLANVCCAEGHLPTGSCISALLSYFAHRKMFLQIHDQCTAKDVTMSVYVDDLTFSGVHATKTMLHEFKRVIRRHGLQTHPDKDALVRPGKPAIITGAVRDGHQIRLRNKHHNSIVGLQDLIAGGEDSSNTKLRGQVAAARSVEPAAANRLEARLSRILGNDNTA
jgi:Reverse transcriptase (RNA-dependent DNA polymerase)